MEIIQTIQRWLYPLIDLILMVYCLTKIRNKGGGFLAIGFALLFTSSIGWRIVDTIRLYENYANYQVVYTVLGQFSFFSNLVFAILFFLGISQLISSSGPATQKELREGMAYQNQPGQKFANIALYVALLFIGLLIFLIGLSLILIIERTSEDAAITMIIIGIIVFIIAEIYFLVFLYRAWRFTINQSYRHNLIPSIETPGKAVGYLFIPIYSLYWIFQAFGKLPKDLNAIARAQGKPHTMSEGLGTTLAVLTLIGVIPIVGYVTAFISGFIIAPIFMRQSINICKSLSQTSENVNFSEIPEGSFQEQDIFCKKCKTEIELDKQERERGFFYCPACGEMNDLKR